jgi:hypothetical protein
MVCIGKKKSISQPYGFSLDDSIAPSFEAARTWLRGARVTASPAAFKRPQRDLERAG